MNPKRWHPELIGLIVAAMATRLWSLFTPNAVVFDEVYFKEFAAHYLDGRYFFDIHPPLGKLLLAGFAHLLGLSPAAMLSGTALGLRFLPAVAGIILIPLVWGILRRLGASRPFAYLGAFAVLFDNALLTESRFILTDSMLLLAGLSAIYFYLIARTKHDRSRWIWLGLAAASAGASASIKWTGLNALAIVLVWWAWDQRAHLARWRRLLGEAAILIFIPILIYAGSFWLHFKLLPNSGDGDAFMSPQFQQTLVGSGYYNPATHLSFLNKFMQLNVEMFKANQTLTATHPYGSRWYTWPLELRPIYYWEGSQQATGLQGNIYLLGNPVVWWGIWIAIISGLLYARLTRRRFRPYTVTALTLAALAFALNLLPFIGVPRVMFLYHYFFSFLYSLIFAVILWNDLATDSHNQVLATPFQRRIFGTVLVLIALGFLYFAPLTYGTPLTPAALQSRIWLPSWR